MHHNRVDGSRSCSSHFADEFNKVARVIGHTMVGPRSVLHLGHSSLLARLQLVEYTLHQSFTMYATQRFRNVACCNFDSATSISKRRPPHRSVLEGELAVGALLRLALLDARQGERADLDRFVQAEIR